MDPWYTSTQTDHRKKTVSPCSCLGKDIQKCMLNRQITKDDYTQWVPAEPPFPEETESYGPGDGQPPEDWEDNIMIDKVRNSCRLANVKRPAAFQHPNTTRLAWLVQVRNSGSRVTWSDPFSPQLHHSNLESSVTWWGNFTSGSSHQADLRAHLSVHK